MKHLSYFFAVLVLSSFPAITPLNAQDLLRINEFMAINDTGLDDENGNEEDWIEIQNYGATTVNLDGWFLTDKADRLTKWRFPATNLPPAGYLIVWASEDNRDNPGKPQHTNFRLGGGGEYLALVHPDGVTIASEFSPAYPEQVADISYGSSSDGIELSLVPIGAPARALIPPDDSLEPLPGSPSEIPRPWTLGALDDTAWLNGATGVGYEAGAGYESYIGLDVISMQNANQTVYIRIPFQVNDPSVLERLTLNMQYDDGFIAYLNGQEIASALAPVDPTWNSGTSGGSTHDDAAAVIPEEFDVTGSLDFLQVGMNMLAIHGLNATTGSSDLLLLPELLATTKSSGETSLRYFTEPTPGQPNNAGVDVLGPIITEAAHAPNVPTVADSITVTARIRAAFAPFASAKLRYRVMFDSEVEIPFLDDGINDDGILTNGVYGAIIPAGVATPGQMVRWHITARDTAVVNSRLPSFVDTFNSPEYFGTLIQNSALTNPLPVLHLFVENIGASENTSGTRCSLSYLDQFYDNLRIDRHGQSSGGFPKKSFDIDFHPGHNFRWKAGEARVDDINLMTTYPDKAHMRNILAHDVYRDAGSPYHFVQPVHVERNGAFFGDAHLMENGDDNYLERNGLDPRGALYKMYNDFQSIVDTTIGQNAELAEKKTRKDEGNADLVDLFSGAVTQAEPGRTRYIYDHVDIPQMINFLAARIITNDRDCCHKNYYLYRDTEGTGEWQAHAWDVDLSFGRNWISSLTYWDQVLSNNGLKVGNNNGLFSKLMASGSVFEQMYFRRIRTLMDELVQPPGTLPSEGRIEQRAYELLELIRADAELDAVQWPQSDTWGNGSGTSTCCRQSIDEAVGEMLNVWLPSRRNQMYNSLTEIPSAQPEIVDVFMTAVDFNPSSGNQAEEYIQITSTNNFAADISGWRLDGGIQHTFKPGTIIPTLGALYVAQDVNAFRARATAPTGGQGLFIQGNYQGQLSARGETVHLIDRKGRVVQTYAYPPSPSLAQQYLRITEIMYNPAPLPGNATDAQSFEYIKLKNIGTETLDLTGVRFANGIFFDFTGSAVASLAAGDVVLIVKDQAAFASRYGTGFNIAGEFGFNLNLSNSGERLQLLDAVGEEILDFSYNNSWYPLTDGLGFSLMVVNEMAEPDLWDSQSQWRWSGYVGGAPGEPVPAFPEFAPILVNEVLTHTDLPVLDAVELYNPTTTNVDVGGWFLTDDFGIPKKYRIPDNTIIEAGDYLVFDESHFNPTPGLPPSFAFSSSDDEVYLFSGNANTNLTGYVQGYSFGAAANGVSFGRHITSVGAEHFVAQSAVTLGNANAGPLVGPIVISEIMYHPPDELVNGILADNNRDEYIELHNVSNASVPLYDLTTPTNLWRLKDAVGYTFPPNVSLEAGEYLMVVSFDPTNTVELDRFRSRFQVPLAVPVYGPWSGQLNNAGDSVELARPDPPNLDGSAPSILVERVNYTDQVPWPAAADGIGPAMHRRVVDEYSDDPANWVAAVPTPGAEFAGGDIPVITQQPMPQSAVEFENTAFSVAVEGVGPFAYLWRSNGVVIPNQTSDTLEIHNVQLFYQANYSVVVLASAGAVVSSNAFLTVLTLPQILQQPQTVIQHPGSNITFTVQVAGTGPVSYQWFYEGQEIPGASENSLTITNIQLYGNDGVYQVAVTDSVGTRMSNPATNIVILRPIVTIHPAPETNYVQAGGSCQFTASAIGTFPLEYRWRRKGATYATYVLWSTNSTLTVENAQTGVDDEYFDVAITSLVSEAGRAQRPSSRAYVIIEEVAPHFVLQPTNQTSQAGVDVTFYSEARGTAPISYQWYFNETNLLADATNGSLVLSNAQAIDVGDYLVVAANSLGSATSEVAALTLSVGELQITTEPADQNVTPCEAASFAVEASGAGALSYQWFFNATEAIPDAVEATLTFAQPHLTNEGAYTVVVADGSQSITSAVATLTLVLGDCDNDGMSDRYELTYGLDPNDPADRDMDPDEDGRTNWEEAQSGTDPRNQASVLRVRLLSVGSGSAVLEFMAMPLVEHTVQYTRQLGSGIWLSLTNIAPLADMATHQIIDAEAGSDGGRYYRIVTPSPAD